MNNSDDSIHIHVNVLFSHISLLDMHGEEHKSKSSVG